MDVLMSRGFEPLEKQYTDSWLHSGQRVTITDGESDEPMEVVIAGLTPAGYLLAERGGDRYELHPDGNSLDFLSGLISKKL